MLAIPHNLQARFTSALQTEKVAESARSYYSKWLLFYLDFCQKHQIDPRQSGSLAPFLDKLREKQLRDWQQKQAAHAVGIYLKLAVDCFVEESHPATEPPAPRPSLSVTSTPVSPPALSPLMPPHLSAPHTVEVCRDINAMPHPRPPFGASWRREYTRLEEFIKVRHYSRKTLQNYRLWLRKFQAFTRGKQPESLTVEDVKEFLTWLAVKREVAASPSSGDTPTGDTPSSGDTI